MRSFLVDACAVGKKPFLRQYVETATESPQTVTPSYSVTGQHISLTRMDNVHVTLVLFSQTKTDLRGEDNFKPR